MRAQLPGLGAPIQVQKVVVADEGVVAKNASLEALVSDLQKRLAETEQSMGN